MFCQRCGSEISDNNKFCEKCGTALKNIPTNKINLQKANGFNPEIQNIPNPQNVQSYGIEPKKSNTGIIISAVIGGCIVLIAVVAAVILGFNFRIEKRSNNNDTFNENEVLQVQHITAAPASATAAPTAGPTEIPTAIPVPVQQTSLRKDRYDSSLTYKRMGNIYNSVLVDDITFQELQAVIIDFDMECSGYMNYNDDAIFEYLRQGTTAYNQQTGYKKRHPNLVQDYDSISVINARTDGSSYYVWVDETITSTENGTTKTSTDHWVYRIIKSGGKYYIEDYTADPLFK